MTDYLTSFVKYGKPKGEPAWEANGSSKKVMIFGDEKTAMGKPSMLKLIGIMLTNKAVGE